MQNSSLPRTEAVREARFYAGIALLILGIGMAIAVGILLSRVASDEILGYWLRVPIEMRITLQLSILAIGVTSAVVATWRAWKEWRGRAIAKARAREKPPIFEFAAGSVTAATLTDGDALEPAARRFVSENRRKYVVRPSDALRRRERDWGAPVVFAEPTRAGDTRLAPVLALAATERKKHLRNMRSLLVGAGQLSGVRVVLGIGKGYTSVTRAHSVKENLARIPGKFRMNLIVTDPPAQPNVPAPAAAGAASATPPDLDAALGESEEVAE